MRTPVDTLTVDLLNAAGWPGGRAPAPNEFPDFRETIGGALKRALPSLEPPERLAVTREAGQGTLLVLEDSERALYRVTLQLGDEPTVVIERIDLARQVTGISVTERNWDDAGRPVVSSRWTFKLDGTDQLVVEDERTSPGLDRLGGGYRFGRAVAEAAGWPPERDEPFVEVT